MNALITRGAASFRGKVKAEGSPVKVALVGDSQFTNFNVLDKLATISHSLAYLGYSRYRVCERTLAGERQFCRNRGFFCLRGNLSTGRTQP